MKKMKTWTEYGNRFDIEALAKAVEKAKQYE